MNFCYWYLKRNLPMVIPTINITIDDAIAVPIAVPMEILVASAAAIE